ncbi:MAG: PorT family protein [Candidatus Latescibacterota bacterium]|nr:MAG: PorT family protein [Candidatus Latescibacterota bacterium]
MKSCKQIGIVLTTLGASLLCVAGAVAGPVVDVGGRIGVNVSSLAYGDMPNGITATSHTGYVVAGFVDLPFAPMMSAELGLALSERGGGVEGTLSLFGNDFTGKANARLLYLDIPLHLELSASLPSARPYLKFGPQLGILLSAKAEVESANLSQAQSEQDIKDDINDVDFQIYLAGGLEFPVSIVHGFVEVGYAWGLADVFADPDFAWLQSQSRVLTISAGVRY